MTDVFCKDCKWFGTGSQCHHSASRATGPHLVNGRSTQGEGWLTAAEMRAANPQPWRQTYCGLDGTLFEASGDE